jgi:hypothetical protein
MPCATRKNTAPSLREAYNPGSTDRRAHRGRGGLWTRSTLLQGKVLFTKDYCGCCSFLTTAAVVSTICTSYVGKTCSCSAFCLQHVMGPVSAVGRLAEWGKRCVASRDLPQVTSRWREPGGEGRKLWGTRGRLWPGSAQIKGECCEYDL